MTERQANSPLRRLLPALPIGWLVIASVLAAGAQLLTIVIRWLVTKGLALPMGSREKAELLLVVSGLAAAMGVSWFVTRAAEWCSQIASVRASRGVMEVLLGWAQQVSLEAFEDSRNHDLIDRARGDLANELGNAVRSLTRLVAATVGLTSLVVLVGRIVPVIVAALTGGAFVIVVLQTRFGLSQYYLRMALTEGERRAESLKGLFLAPGPAREIRVFHSADWLIAQWRSWTLRGARARGFQLAKHLVVHLLHLVEVALTAGAIVLGVYQFQRGSISLQQLAFLIVSVQPLVGYAFSMAHESQTLSQAWALLSDFGRLLNLNDKQDGTQEQPTRRSVESKEDVLVACRNVSFTYPGASTSVIRDVSLVLSRSERVAVVGSNGAGKTTLALLLLGVYKPDAGSVEWEGKGPRPRVVMQHFNRYHLSVAANVGVGALGEGGLRRRTLQEAAQASELTGVVDRLPSRWRTLLSGGWGDGAELSGGEWQRVALARAFCGGSDLWVFDEPASSLDPLAEREMNLRLLHASGNDAVLIISHRLSMLGLVDRVIVLENGRIAEDGSPARLLENPGGLFRALYESQAKWYR